MFRRDHVILSFQNSQTLQFFLFLSLFVLFKQFLLPCTGAFYTKSRDLHKWWQLELYSWYWHVVVFGLWKVAIFTVENSSIDCYSRLSSFSGQKSLMAQARVDHRVLARSNKSSMNFWKLTNVKSTRLWTVK